MRGVGGVMEEESRMGLGLRPVGRDGRCEQETWQTSEQKESHGLCQHSVQIL